jgi:uncharacterized damage-inducible protein DinB
MAWMSGAHHKRRITMREELTRLEQQVQRAFEGEAWHGPAVLEVLEGVTAEQAGAHPIPGAHSIGEIVLHITATYRLVLQRIHGQSVSLTPDEDWPVVAAWDSQSWHQALDALRQVNQQLRRAIVSFTGDLDDMLAAGSSSAYVQFAGLPQHDAYHSGQISLLRKALMK